MQITLYTLHTFSQLSQVWVWLQVSQFFFYSWFLNVRKKESKKWHFQEIFYGSQIPQEDDLIKWVSPNKYLRKIAYSIRVSKKSPGQSLILYACCFLFTLLFKFCLSLLIRFHNNLLYLMYQILLMVCFWWQSSGALQVKSFDIKLCRKKNDNTFIGLGLFH